MNYFAQRRRGSQRKAGDGSSWVSEIGPKRTFRPGRADVSFRQRFGRTGVDRVA